MATQLRGGAATYILAGGFETISAPHCIEIVCTRGVSPKRRGIRRRVGVRRLGFVSRNLTARRRVYNNIGGKGTAPFHPGVGTLVKHTYGAYLVLLMHGMTATS